MKTNKQKALELINSKMVGSNDLNHNQLISTSVATSAVILASKPDWFYPGKNALPKNIPILARFKFTGKTVVNAIE